MLNMMNKILLQGFILYKSNLFQNKFTSYLRMPTLDIEIKYSRKSSLKSKLLFCGSWDQALIDPNIMQIYELT